MAKLTLTDLVNINNHTSAVGIINSNSAATETALENTLSRDGTSPNEMEADLDMNSNRILNLPAPVDDNEPARLIDLQSVSGATSKLDDLTDVVITTPADDQFLRYDGTKWINETVANSGSAPDSADFLVKTANAGLTSERVGTDNTAITWDWGTSGQAKAVRAALTGDVTASSNSNATTIANDAVTFAKMQNIATNSLIGRDTAATGDPENILLNATLSMDGSNNLQRAALTGDVTATAGSNATTIANDAVTFAKMANLATSRVVGRVTAGTGDPEALTGAQVGGLITLDNLSDVTLAGTTSGDILQYSGTAWANAPVGSFGAPSSADYLTKTSNAGLSAERTVGDSTTVTANWGTPGTVTFERAALTGDVTASANANATTIANDAVTYAKMQNVSAADVLLGRGHGSGSGDAQEIALGTGLSMSGTTLNASVGGGGGLLAANNLSDVSNASTSRTNLGLAIGTNVQAYDADLDALAANSTSGLWAHTGAGTGSARTITAGTGISVANGDGVSGNPTVTLNTLTGQTIPVTFVVACSDETTALTAGTNKVKWRMPHAMTVTSVRGSLSTAQTSGSIFTVDINESGSTIISTKITIDNTETTTATAATAPVISDASLADDAEMSVDIDQVGDGTAKGLKIMLIGTRTI